jgi:hypothetical protein
VHFDFPPAASRAWEKKYALLGSYAGGLSASRAVPAGATVLSETARPLENEIPRPSRDHRNLRRASVFLRRALNKHTPAHERGFRDPACSDSGGVLVLASDTPVGGAAIGRCTMDDGFCIIGGISQATGRPWRAARKAPLLLRR